MLQIQSKRFYLDVKQNRRGRFIKVAEVNIPSKSIPLLTFIIGFSYFLEYKSGLLLKISLRSLFLEHFRMKYLQFLLTLGFDLSVYNSTLQRCGNQLIFILNWFRKVRCVLHTFWKIYLNSVENIGQRERKVRVDSNWVAKYYLRFYLKRRGQEITDVELIVIRINSLIELIERSET